MTEITTNEYAARPDLLRRAVAQHRTWIEQQLATSFSDVVLLETDLDLAQIGAELCLGVRPPQGDASSTVKRLRKHVQSATTPREFPPLFEISKTPRTVDLLAALEGRAQSQSAVLSWEDCPIALRMRRGDTGFTAVVLNVRYHTGPGSDIESTARLMIVRRQDTSEAVGLIEYLDRRDNRPRLCVLGGSDRLIAPCAWADLTLDWQVSRMLRDDFESFFQRQAWFKQNNLPFRRGYLLHGRPGNGKTSTIRAMMTSRGLTAYTMRLFDARQDDSDLDRLFELAVENRPSMILLEDLDRAFPKTGETKSRVSLQQLLNCLDGVSTGEGVVTVATANEPTILDPAILRRPGRFDRVVYFPNPGSELRQRYLQRLNPNLAALLLKKVVDDTEGFSFAQLREIHVIAGQRAFERKADIGDGDLLLAIRALRRSSLAVSTGGSGAGFRGPREV